MNLSNMNPDKKASLLVFAAATALFLIFLALLPGSLSKNDSGDYTSFYLPVAKNLANGHGLVVGAHRDPALRYPPGYPMILATVIKSGDVVGLSVSNAVKVMSALLMGAAASLIHFVSRRLFNPLVAWITTFLWLSYPLNLWMAKQPNSEIPFVVLLISAVAVLVPILKGAEPTWKRLAGAGALIAGASLIRPVGLITLVPVVVLVLRSRNTSASVRWQGAAACVLAFLVVIAPWEVYASAKNHALVPLSTGGALSIRDGIEYGAKEKHNGNTFIPSPTRKLMRDAVNQTKSRDPKQSLLTTGHIVKFLAKEAKKRPAGFAGLIGLKFVRAWYGTESFRYEKLIFLAQIPYVLLIAWGAVISWRRKGDAKRTALFLLGLLAGYWFMTMAVLTIVRYLTPAIGLCMILAALGPAAVISKRYPELAQRLGGPSPA